MQTRVSFRLDLLHRVEKSKKHGGLEGRTRDLFLVSQALSGIGRGRDGDVEIWRNGGVSCFLFFIASCAGDIIRVL